jgi:hypothetical protein
VRLGEEPTVERNPRFDEYGYPIEPFTEIVPGLFQADSTCSPHDLFAHGFDAVFDLCGFDRVGTEFGGYVVHAIDDVPWLSDPEAIDDLAGQVAKLVRSGSKVAVNCMSGLNRSGLLVARTLIELGFTAPDAIELVRRARGPHALSNRAFVRYLLIDCSPRGLARRRAL